MSQQKYIHNQHSKDNVNLLLLPITGFHPHAKLWYISYSHRNSSRVTHSFDWLGIKSCPIKNKVVIMLELEYFWHLI